MTEHQGRTDLSRDGAERRDELLATLLAQLPEAAAARRRRARTRRSACVASSLAVLAAAVWIALPQAVPSAAVPNPTPVSPIARTPAAAPSQLIARSTATGAGIARSTTSRSRVSPLTLRASRITVLTPTATADSIDTEALIALADDAGLTLGVVAVAGRSRIVGLEASPGTAETP